jgi:phage terminase large subunit-like protein
MSLTTYRKFNAPAQARRARRISQGGVEVEDFSGQRRSLAAFWVWMLGEGKAPQPHHLEWIEALQTGQDSEALTAIAGPNLEIRGPRDSAKSTFAVIACAWVIGWNPGIRLLYLSYSEAIALEQSRKIKRVLSSPRYQQIFPWIRIGDRTGVEDWEIDKSWALNHRDRPPTARITAGNELDATYTLYAAGVLGSVMGKRADFIFCDDLIKSAEAIASAEVRAKMNENISGVIEPCLVVGGRWVDVGMLARRDDIHLSFFTEDNGFRILKTSAIQTDPDGTERSYWEARHPLEKLQGRRSRSPKIFALQFQNDEPEDTENAIIQRDWIQWAEPPLTPSMRLYLAVDLAATEKEESDYTAMVLIGRVAKPLTYWVLGCHLFKESGNLGKLKRISELRKELGPFRLIFEKGAYQNSFEGDWRDYRRETDPTLNDCPIEGIQSTRDLRQRLTAVSGVVENGLVWFASGGRSLGVLEQQLVMAHTDELDHDDAASAFALGLRGIMGRGKGNTWSA